MSASLRQSVIVQEAVGDLRVGGFRIGLRQFLLVLAEPLRIYALPSAFVRVVTSAGRIQRGQSDKPAGSTNATTTTTTTTSKTEKEPAACLFVSNYIFQVNECKKSVQQLGSESEDMGTADCPNILSMMWDTETVWRLLRRDGWDGAAVDTLWRQVLRKATEAVLVWDADLRIRNASIWTLQTHASKSESDESVARQIINLLQQSMGMHGREIICQPKTPSCSTRDRRKMDTLGFSLLGVDYSIRANGVVDVLEVNPLPTTHPNTAALLADLFRSMPGMLDTIGILPDGDALPHIVRDQLDSFCTSHVCTDELRGRLYGWEAEKRIADRYHFVRTFPRGDALLSAVEACGNVGCSGLARGERGDLASLCAWEAWAAAAGEDRYEAEVLRPSELRMPVWSADERTCTWPEP
jgi:hypothetical protein